MSTVPTRAELLASEELGLSFLDDPTLVVDAIPVPTHERPLNRLQRFAYRVALAALRLAQRLRRGVASVDQTRAGVYICRLKRAHAYTPRHRAQRLWYGRRRSTSESNVRRANESRRAAREGHLPGPPREFIGVIENLIETLRYEQEVLHAPRHREGEFICS